MPKIAEFKPIYIWAQAKDNKAEDDFFEISNSGTKAITDLGIVQRKVYEMNKVVEASDLSDKKFINKTLNNGKKYTDHFKSLSVSHQDKKVVLSFGTKDLDNVGRASNIDVFLDLNNIDASNISEYVKYFYNGFRQFCDITDRHPFDLEKVSSAKFERLLENKVLKKTLDSLPEFIASKPIYLVVILIILAVYIMIATR